CRLLRRHPPEGAPWVVGRPAPPPPAAPLRPAAPSPARGEVGKHAAVFLTSPLRGSPADTVGRRVGGELQQQTNRVTPPRTQRTRRRTRIFGPVVVGFMPSLGSLSLGSLSWSLGSFSLSSLAAASVPVPSGGVYFS